MLLDKKNMCDEYVLKVSSYVENIRIRYRKEVREETGRSRDRLRFFGNVSVCGTGGQRFYCFSFRSNCVRERTVLFVYTWWIRKYLNALGAHSFCLSLDPLSGTL